MNKIISAHGGFRELKSYQNATIVYDFTVQFCEKFVKNWRMRDQMIHAARSGRQNIAEGSQTSGTSKKTELKLVRVARASQEELLLDYEDYLRQGAFEQWNSRDPRALEIRALAYRSNRSYTTYMTYSAFSHDAANVAICLVHQTNYLLDQQLRALEQAFTREGGFTERLYRSRKTR